MNRHQAEQVHPKFVDAQCRRPGVWGYPPNSPLVFPKPGQTQAEP